MKQEYKRRNHQALMHLIDWTVTAAELARVAGVHQSTVSYWLSQGKVSQQAATTIANFPGCPLTREQIRSDIKVWK